MANDTLNKILNIIENDFEDHPNSLTATRDEWVAKIDNMLEHIYESDFDDDTFCDSIFNIAILSISALKASIDKREFHRLGRCTCTKCVFGIIEVDSSCKLHGKQKVKGRGI